MFLVLNKEKIYAYLVSILTVCLLFFIASTNTQKDIETSTNAETTNSIETDKKVEVKKSIETNSSEEKSKITQTNTNLEASNSTENDSNGEKNTLENKMILKGDNLKFICDMISDNPVIEK